MSNNADFSRQSFLGPHSEELLRNLRVAIVGLGGGGSHIAQQLAHAGVGNFRLIDPDVIEASNLNRLVGGTQHDVDGSVPKVEIARRTILDIRPWANVRVAQSTWQKADRLIRDAHIVFGCVDGYQQRDYLELATRRFGLPLIDIGMDVTEIAPGSFAVAGQMIMTLPDAPCLRCLGFLTPDKLAQEENRYGDVGINPQVVWTNGMLASLAVGQMMQLITPWTKAHREFTWLELDGNVQTVTPSAQPDYFPRQSPCPHRAGKGGLGDPAFDVRDFLAAHPSNAF